MNMNKEPMHCLRTKSKGVISILAPDYSSLSNFPGRAFKSPSGAINKKRQRMVRFLSSANEEFIIQPRNSQEHSVSEEEQMNRISRLRLEIEDTLEDMERLDEEEFDLLDKVGDLKAQAGDGGVIIQARRVIGALESKSSYLEREILDMKMTMLQIKGKNERLQKDLLLLELRKAKNSCWTMKAIGGY